VGAGLPRQADLLIVIGDVTHKAAPVLQRLHARMADPSYVLWVRTQEAGAPRPALYPTAADVTALVPVDVTLEGDPPSPAAALDALARLRQRVRAREERA
jgi:NADH:ubiquinone oxidoreductase subunit B-like Fe-S oxidoreductase